MPNIQQEILDAVNALAKLSDSLIAFQDALGGPVNHALALAPIPVKRGPGRPPKALPEGVEFIQRKAITSVADLPPMVPAKKRKKAPIQYCPVPGCKNRAAPVFGMVCGEHKDVAKSKIAKYRADRKKAAKG